MTTIPPSRCTASMVAVAVLALGSLLAACSGDDGAPSGDVTTTVSPEDVRVPLSEVVAGLPAVAAGGESAAAAAARGDFEAALEAYDEMHRAWAEVEGTLKETDPDAYDAIETAQGLMRDGAENDNADRVAAGAAALSAAIEAFLADHG